MASLDLIRELNSHGGAVRSRLPIVSDAQVGLSIASPQQTAPAVVPGSAPSTRPALTSAMEVEVADLSWPPQPGEYTDRGLVKQAGELTALLLALTYAEVRAFVLGHLRASESPSRNLLISGLWEDCGPIAEGPGAVRSAALRLQPLAAF